MEKEEKGEKVVRRWRPRFEGVGPFSKINILSTMLGEAEYFRLTGREHLATKVEENLKEYIKRKNR